MLRGRLSVMTPAATCNVGERRESDVKPNKLGRGKVSGAKDTLRN